MTSTIADFIVSLGPHGSAIGRENISDILMKDPDLRDDVAAVIQDHGKEDKSKVPEEPKEVEKITGQLTTEEEIVEGRIGWDACESVTLSTEPSEAD